MHTILDYLNYDVSLYLYDNYIFRNRSYFDKCIQEYHNEINNYCRIYHCDIMKNLIILHKTIRGNSRLRKMNFVRYIRNNRGRKRIYDELTEANRRAIEWKKEAKDIRRLFDHNYQKSIYKMLLD